MILKIESKNGELGKRLIYKKLNAFESFKFWCKVNADTISLGFLATAFFVVCSLMMWGAF